VFALNLDVRDPSHIADRMKLTPRQCLAISARSDPPLAAIPLARETCDLISIPPAHKNRSEDVLNLPSGCHR